MKANARTAAMPWLVSLLLIGASLHAATLTRGRVVGPASLAQNGAISAPHLMAAAAACTVYFDATGQLSFNPPNASARMFSDIRPTDILPGGPSAAHGIRAVQATPGGALSLKADAAIDSILLAPIATRVGRAVQGIAYFATSTTCAGASDFTTIVESRPSGINAPPPSGTVVARLNGRVRMDASYELGYHDEGTYLCSGVEPGYILCEVWRVDVTFNFLTSSFDANGAGNYSLTIHQVSMTSP